MTMSERDEFGFEVLWGVWDAQGERWLTQTYDEWCERENEEW